MVGEQPWNKLVGHLKVKFIFLMFSLRRCRSFGEKKSYKGDSGWDLYPKRPLAGASIYICLHRVLSTGDKANREWHRKKCVRIFKETSDKSV